MYYSVDFTAGFPQIIDEHLSVEDFVEKLTPTQIEKILDEKNLYPITSGIPMPLIESTEHLLIMQAEIYQTMLELNNVNIQLAYLPLDEITARVKTVLETKYKSQVHSLIAAFNRAKNLTEQVRDEIRSQMRDLEVK